MTPTSTSTKLGIGGETIIDDRLCPSCGYSLKGLVSGGTCPECGTTIRAYIKRYDDTLGDAPARFLTILRAGFVIMGVGGLVTLLLILTILMDFFFLQPADMAIFGGLSSSAKMRTVLLPLSIGAWSFGSIMVTIPRPEPGGSGVRRENGMPEWHHLRTGIRAGALALVIGTLLWLVAELADVAILQWIGVVFVGAGTASVVLTCIYVSNLAHWASDSHSAMQLMYAGLGIAVSGPLAALMFSPLKFVVGVFLPVVLMLLLASMLWLSTNVLKMNSTISWAIINTRERVARDERIAKKAREQAAEAARRSGYAPPDPNTPDPHLLATIERQNAAADVEAREQAEREQARRKEQEQRGHNVDSSGADPYALEDD